MTQEAIDAFRAAEPDMQVDDATIIDAMQQLEKRGGDITSEAIANFIKGRAAEREREARDR